MKTRDAFALRDFDAEKILARLDFLSGDYTDEEILSSFWRGVYSKFFAEDDNRAYYIATKLDVFMDLVNHYQTRLIRHNDRLLRYAVLLVDKHDIDETIQSKIRRAKNLSASYTDAARSVQDLKKKIHKLIMAVDDCREEKYRRRFAERLKEARSAAGMTQRQIAAKLEMTPAGYSQYETTRTEPSIPMLVKIARILNRSVDWLLGLTP